MENNVVLYRKYRPQNFSEIIGQEHIVRTLINSIKLKSVSHAYLFIGPRGSGKTTIARIFAKAVNCESDSSIKPCEKCGSCKEIMLSNSMDIIEIDGASNTGIDNVRELIDGIKFSPVKSRYKICIIDECHQLSKAANNALLKTLEEPPSHSIFILATTEAQKMLPTIISRCQRFDFKRLHVPEIEKKLGFILKKEKIKFEPAVLPLIAMNARGSFRDAESLLDKCVSFVGGDKVITVSEVKELLGLVEIGQVSRIVDFLVDRKTKEAVLYVNNLAEEGIDLQEFTKTLVFYLRQCLLLKINPDFSDQQGSGLSNEEIVKIKKQIEKQSEKETQKMLELFIDAESKIKYAVIPQLSLEMAIIEAIYRET